MNYKYLTRNQIESISKIYDIATTLEIDKEHIDDVIDINLRDFFSYKGVIKSKIKTFLYRKDKNLEDLLNEIDSIFVYMKYIDESYTTYWNKYFEDSCKLDAVNNIRMGLKSMLSEISFSDMNEKEENVLKEYIKSVYSIVDDPNIALKVSHSYFSVIDSSLLLYLGFSAYYHLKDKEFKLMKHVISHSKKKELINPLLIGINGIGKLKNIFIFSLRNEFKKAYDLLVKYAILVTNTHIPINDLIMQNVNKNLTKIFTNEYNKIKSRFLKTKKDKIKKRLLQKISSAYLNSIYEAIQEGYKKYILKEFGINYNSKISSPLESMLLYHMNLIVNKKFLGKGIKEYLSGKNGVKLLMSFKENRRFVNRLRRRINLRPWLYGFEKEYKIKDSKIHVYIERNIEKLIDIGNIVNSCISLGREYQEGIASYILDINKAILYIERDGKFIGRKVIGISSHNRLVIYPTYYSNINRKDEIKIEQCLADYILNLSKEMRINIHKTQYPVEQVDSLNADFFILDNYDDSLLNKIEEFY